MEGHSMAVYSVAARFLAITPKQRRLIERFISQ